MFCTRFNPARVGGVKFDAPSLTQPQFKSLCDIGNMIRRALSGDTSVFGRATYFDASNAPEDFADAQYRLAAARSIWNDLSDEMKKVYGSPERLLASYDAQLADKRKQAVKQAVKPSVPEPTSEPVTAKADAPSTGAAHAATT